MIIGNYFLNLNVTLFIESIFPFDIFNSEIIKVTLWLVGRRLYWSWTCFDSVLSMTDSRENFAFFDQLIRARSFWITNHLNELLFISLSVSKKVLFYGELFSRNQNQMFVHSHPCLTKTLLKTNCENFHCFIYEQRDFHSPSKGVFQYHSNQTDFNNIIYT